jgi:predicted nucleic acid-binding protein
MEVVTVGSDLIKEAIDTSIQNGISFWDALIVVAAEAARCRYLHTEDLNDGQVIRGVRIQKPFR